jgi:hypothetical protein
VEHTPGPWSIRIAGTLTGKGPEIYKDGPYYDDNSEFVIADCGTSHHRPEGIGKWRKTSECAEVEANARLIAAAPDMYLALTRIRDRVASLRDLHPEWADIMDAAVHAEDFSAIAKAEGK